MGRQEWLVFLPQVPSSPSSLRVTVWRRLRTAGALSLQNGVWLLPNGQDQERFARELLSEVASSGGSSLILTAALLAGEGDEAIMERFRADRDREYGEFCERCAEFLKEVEKETARRKFTFAELEEIDEDYHKLTGWLAKIQARDFFGGHQAKAAADQKDACRTALEGFSRSVYAYEGVDLTEAEATESGAAPNHQTAQKGATEHDA